MNLGRILKFLRPTARWECPPIMSTCPDGEGGKYEDLVWMSSDQDKPSYEEVLSAELPAEKSFRIRGIKSEAMTRIEAVAPAWKQINTALGFYPSEKSQAIKDSINAVRSASDAAEAAVNALTTVAEVQGFTW